MNITDYIIEHLKKYNFPVTKYERDEWLKLEAENKNKNVFGTMINGCEHEIEKLYSITKDNIPDKYIADYCKKCKGIY